MNHQQMIKPMLIGVAAFAVLALAGVPVLNYLPLLLVLACPLMMFFMMGSMMGGHGESGQQDHSHAGHDRDEPQ